MKKIEGGTVHTMQADLQKAIQAEPKVLALWQEITPLARNEWICWVTSGKKAETRDIRINKTISKMKGGSADRAVGLGVSIVPINQSVNQYSTFSKKHLR